MRTGACRTRPRRSTARTTNAHPPRPDGGTVSPTAPLHAAAEPRTATAGRGSPRAWYPTTTSASPCVTAIAASRTSAAPLPGVRARHRSSPARAPASRPAGRTPTRLAVEADDAVDVLPRDAGVVDGGRMARAARAAALIVGPVVTGVRLPMPSDDGGHSTRQCGSETSSPTSSNSTRTGRSARSARGLAAADLAHQHRALVQLHDARRVGHAASNAGRVARCTTVQVTRRAAPARGEPGEAGASRTTDTRVAARSAPARSPRSAAGAARGADSRPRTRGCRVPARAAAAGERTMVTPHRHRREQQRAVGVARRRRDEDQLGVRHLAGRRAAELAHASVRLL